MYIRLDLYRGEGPDTISEVVKFIFSWIVLLPIAVIVGGKFLSQIHALRLEGENKQLFKIPLKILDVQATDDEVIYGFAAFITTLLVVAIFFGPNAYYFFRIQFGIDPGQFNSLCILSSFITVIWTFLIFLFNKLRIKDSLFEERDKYIEDLSKKTHDEVKNNGESHIKR